MNVKITRIDPKDKCISFAKICMLKYIKEQTDYQVIGDRCIIAYKSTNSDGSSRYDASIRYEVDKTYESNCDCNINKENSFGLSAWTKEKALDYHSTGKLFVVAIDIEDIGAILFNSKKIRCFKLRILAEVNKDYLEKYSIKVDNTEVVKIRI